MVRGVNRIEKDSIEEAEEHKGERQSGHKEKEKEITCWQLPTSL